MNYNVLVQSSRNRIDVYWVIINNTNMNDLL
jgi:hypothetical protein